MSGSTNCEGCLGGFISVYGHAGEVLDISQQRWKKRGRACDAFALISRIHLGELGSVWNLRSRASLSVSGGEGERLSYNFLILYFIVD